VSFWVFALSLGSLLVFAWLVDVAFDWHGRRKRRRRW